MAVKLPATLPLARLYNGALFRICRSRYAADEPSFRASGAYRFDDPSGRFGTLYCADSFRTCFFETLIRDRGDLTVSALAYESRSLVCLLADTSRLNLVRLHGSGAQRIGFDLAVLAGNDYRATQDIAAAVYAHPSLPHGMVYRSRFNDDELAVVLFDRARAMVRLLPGSAPVALTKVSELADPVREDVPFVFVK